MSLPFPSHGVPRALIYMVSAAVLFAACTARGGNSGTATPVAGEQLAVTIDRTLYLQQGAGTRRALVSTNDTAVYPVSPRWLPDGSGIAYVQQHLFAGAAGADWGDDIYIEPLAGGAPRLLRAHREAGQQVEGFAWFPDGRSVLLGDVRLASSTDVLHTTSRLVRFDVASQKETTVVQGGIDPSISRDGTRIAYLQPTGDSVALMTAASDGSGAREVVPADAFPQLRFPHISPDGQSIVFAAPTPAAVTRPGPAGVLAGLAALLRPAVAEAHGLPMWIWRVDIASGKRTALTPFTEDDPYPVWSPDGQSILIIAGGGFYKALADGSAVQKLGDGALSAQMDVRGG